MSAFYNQMAKTAKKLIDQFGYEVTLERFVNGEINPVTGQGYEKLFTDVKVKGILLDYNSDEIDGTKILRTDKKLLIEASEKPVITDKPKANGEYLGTIVHIEEKNPAGVPLVYFLQMRK